jgi:RimJ/RimL family protein N-acetyltransferase
MAPVGCDIYTGEPRAEIGVSVHVVRYEPGRADRLVVLGGDVCPGSGSAHAFYAIGERERRRQVSPLGEVPAGDDIGQFGPVGHALDLVRGTHPADCGLLRRGSRVPFEKRQVWEYPGVSSAAVSVRLATDADRYPLAVLFAAVAEERNGIAAEPPVDVEKWASRWDLDRTFVALIGDEVVGELHVERTPFGYGELGMMVAAGSRGRGVGTALLVAAIAWARQQGLHKLSLGVFASNTPARGLYRKLGFVEEGLRVKQIRRANGELWDLVEMGLLL